MFNKIIISFALISFLGVINPPSALAVDYGATTTENKFKKADIVIVQMNDIRASVFTFYDDNAALPANMGLLTNSAMVYYTGNIRSAFGTAFSAAISGDGRFFNVTVDLQSSEIAAYVAQRLNTQPTGNFVTLSIGTPASSIVDNGFLARNFDPARPELNKMRTDLSLGGNDINDIDNARANRINISDLATIDTLNVIAKTTTLNLDTTGTANLNDTNISGDTVFNTATVNGAAAFNNTVVFNDSITVNQTSKFIGAAIFNDINIDGYLRAIGGGEIYGGLKVVNGIDVDTVTTDVITSKTGTIDTLKVSDTLTATSIETNNLLAKNIESSGRVKSYSSLVTHDQTVQGTSFLNKLDVTNLSVLRGGLKVLGETNIGDLSIDGNTMVNGQMTAALGVFLGDHKTHIGKSTSDDSVRFRNTAGWLDLGVDSTGIVSFETDANGYTFDHKITATGSGGDISLNASNGYPEIVFSRLNNDVTFGLTGPTTLSIYGADLKTKNNIYAREIFENNVSLKNRYLDINAKAKDSDKLDGLSSEDFARKEHKHNRLEGSGWQNVNLNTLANSVPSGTLQYDQFSRTSKGNPIAGNNASGVITVGQHSGGYTAQLAFTSDGNMYQRSNPGTSIGSWGKVWTSTNDGSGSGLDADLLAGKHASSYVNKDVANTFAKRQTFSAGITTNGANNYLNGVTNFEANRHYGTNKKYAINLQNSDVAGLNGIFFADKADSTSEGILFPRFNNPTNISHYSNIRANDGVMYFNPIANGASYKVSNGVNLYENNNSLSNIYLKKSDASVLKTIKNSSSYLGLKVGGSDTAWLRTTRSGILPWATGESYLGTSGWKFKQIHAVDFYENGTRLTSKYLSKGGTAQNSLKLGGYTAATYLRNNVNATISKKQPWLSLKSMSWGPASDQMAGISIGESGYKGTHALHLTYNGNGTSYIGMGGVNGTTGKPSKVVLEMNSRTNNAYFHGDIYEKGVKLEDKYQLKGKNSDTYVLLFRNSHGQGRGDIYLKESYRNFKELVIIGGNDSVGKELSINRFKISDYDKARSFGSSISIYNAGSEGSSSGWFGYFSTTKTFKTVEENGRLYAIYGVTRI